MLDPASLPILLKVLDFLFDEGSKILRERRERRNDERKLTKSKEDSVPVSVSTDEQIKTIGSREEALSVKITESAWSAAEDEVKHLLTLLDVYTQNYYLAKEQYAKFGSALVPQIVVHNLAEAEDGVALTSEKLRDILSTVYKQVLLVPGIDK